MLLRAKLPSGQVLRNRSSCANEPPVLPPWLGLAPPTTLRDRLYRALVIRALQAETEKQA